MVGHTVIRNWNCLSVLDGSVRFYSDRNQPADLREPTFSRTSTCSCTELAGPTCTRIVRPTERHWTVFQQVLTDGQAVANLVSDAHLAALAIEHGCELASTDSDFARFAKLKWKNPLV